MELIDKFLNLIKIRFIILLSCIIQICILTKIMFILESEVNNTNWLVNSTKCFLLSKSPILDNK